VQNGEENTTKPVQNSQPMRTEAHQEKTAPGTNNQSRKNQNKHSCTGAAHKTGIKNRYASDTLKALSI